MSGGQWDYQQYRQDDFFEDLSNDGRLMREFPRVHQALCDLKEFFSNKFHKLDYHLSGDTIIEDKEQFEIDFMENLGHIIEKEYKVRIYETKLR